MRCSDCFYSWVDDGCKCASCHWVERAPGDLPPCEQEDYDDEISEYPPCDCD